MVRDSDSPALMILPVDSDVARRARPRRATVGQLSGYHLAASCSNC